MNYSKKDIIIGFVIIGLIILGAFYYKKIRTPKLTSTPTPLSISFQDELEDSFKYNIPDDVSSIELIDISGGDGRGVATDKEVLIDIKDPASNSFYQAWLVNGDEAVSLGKLQMAKGGWLLTYDRSKYPEYKKLIISLESIFDNKIETKILEGSFN